MELQLDRIVHHPDHKPPLRVFFSDGRFARGDVYEIDADAAQVQTFAAFQRLVANRLGIWLECPPVEESRTARMATEEWSELVRGAFDAGRPEADGK